MNITFRNVLSAIKEHKFNSLYFKYLKMMLLFCISFFMILFAVVFYYAFNNLRNEQENLIERTSELTEFQFKNVVRRIYDISYSVVNDNGILNYLNENEDISQNNSKALESVKVYSSGVNSNYIDSVFLFSFKNRYVYSTKYSSAHIDEFFYTDWYREYIDNNEIVSYFSNEKYSMVPSYLSVTVPIHQNKDVLGLLVFNIDISSFLKENIPENVGVLISDSKKRIITDYNITGERLDNSTKNIGVSNIGELNLTITIMPVSGLFPKMITLIFIMILLFIILMSLSVCIAFVAAKICYNFIILITTNINLIMNGETPEETLYEETRNINANLLNLVFSSHNLEEKLARNIVELNKLTMQSMQLQINPHFLFNTLTMINMIAMRKCEDTTLSDSIILLSDILRIVLDTSETVVDLRSEMEYSHKYIDILCIREMNSFKTVWEIPQELMDKKVVKFSLQPLIENAFEHGIKRLRLERERLIIIKAFERDGNLVIQVKDNGNIISDKKIKEINASMLTDELPADKHMGLKNTNVRIKLTFGEKYGCRLLKEKDMTVAELLFPM